MDFLRRVNADFQAILEKTGPVEQMLQLAEQMKLKGMHINGRPFPTFLKPYFLNLRQRQPIAEATRRIVSAVEKIGAAFLSGYNFNGLLHQDGLMDRLSRIDPLYPNYQVIMRLDAFFHPSSGEVKFLEFNCGDPTGMGNNDALLDMFLQLPVMRELSKKYNLHADYLLVSQFKVVLRKYRQFCKRKNIPAKPKPNCAIVCSRDRDTGVVGDLQVMVDYYNHQGCTCKLADPRDFKYDGQKLTLHGVEIDVIYRDSIGDFIVYAQAKTALQAYRDGNVCFINPVRAATGDFKNLLAVMSDEQYHPIFSPDEITAITRHIPWTRSVRESKTHFHNHEIDLAPFLRSNKDRFVLKPNRGHSGFGVVLGPETGQIEWEKALDRALSADYTVQEFVRIPTEYFPSLENGNYLGFKLHNVNINYWSHDGEFAGAYMRASASTIINVGQGGGYVPVFFVEE